MVNYTFNTIFNMDSLSIIKLLKELCKDKINFSEFDMKPTITKSIKNDVCEKITISSYGKLIIDSEGVNYIGEHSNENTIIVRFDKFFNLEVFLDELENDEDDTEFIKQGDSVRGFSVLEFTDLYGSECSIQKSSSAFSDNIWLGSKKLNIKEFCGGGWVERPEFDTQNFVGCNRMHLSVEMVSKLLPVLQKFVETGEVINSK